MSNPTYILRYFPLVGLSEACRLLLTAANVEWTEEHPEWPQEKPNQPHGRLPVLVEKNPDGSPDFIITESCNIERYLARVYGFVPADPKQAARQEQICELMADVFSYLSGYIRASSDESKQMFLGKFEALLETLIEVQTKLIEGNGNNGRQFGDSLSYADMVAYGFYKKLMIAMARFDANVPKFVKSKLTPKITQLIATVEADPLLEKHTSKAESLAAAVSV
ncbi:hypothetical protein LPJ63_003965 [Coemansia sp. RSA 2711]|nr:hypothetical protein LPJ63_003965 [Coemansia sp. RSA 2711]